MMRSKSQSSRCDWRPALGALLLALPLYGLVARPRLAEAQPATTAPPTFQPAPLTPEQTKAIDRIAAVVRCENLCRSSFDIKLENGTIDDAIARIKAAFPTQQVEIRQRDVRPLKLSLNLKDTNVGAVLSGMAALSNSVLWVMPDGLLIAPPAKLNQTERDLVGMMYAGAWTQSRENPINAGNVGNAAVSWTAQQDGEVLMANIIAAEVKLLKVDGPVKATFGQFSPQAQKALQQLVAWTNDDVRNIPGQPLFLSFGSPVKVGFKVGFRESKWLTIDLTKGPSDPYASETYMNILLSE